MPRYRVLARSFINGTLCEPGEVVDYDGKPGSALESLEPAAAAAVDIPVDWRGLADVRRIMLARRLGAPAKGTGVKEADAFIEAEMARREPAPKE